VHDTGRDVMSVRVNYESVFIPNLTEDSDETRGSQQEIQSYPLIVCSDAKLTCSSSNSCTWGLFGFMSKVAKFCRA
jgi:hypothetical protein